MPEGRNRRLPPTLKALSELAAGRRLSIARGGREIRGDRRRATNSVPAGVRRRRSRTERSDCVVEGVNPPRDVGVSRGEGEGEGEGKSKEMNC